MKRWLVLAAVVTAACGGKDKPDVDVAFEAVGAEGGTWKVLQAIDTDHPYTNDTDQSWTLQANPGSDAIRLVLTQFELEDGYDILEVRSEDGTVQQLTGTRSGDVIQLEGTTATLRFVSDYSVTAFGASITVEERVPCACTEQYQPVCGADGQTYSNDCEASCGGAAVIYRGQCDDTRWFRVDRVTESAHPYANNGDDNFVIREGGSTAIRVHFAEVDVERGYDFLRLLDGNDQVVANYSGQASNYTSVVVAGDTAKLRLVTDGSVTKYGFKVDYYEVVGGCASDTECGPGNVCMQVQCIRAPCFNSCQPANTGGPIEVTVQDLEADPARYDGVEVRVMGTPSTRALCTRRGCTQDNPCCNRCSGNFTIGQGINLRSLDGQPYGCSGDECSWESTCREFLPNDSGPYNFQGVFSVETRTNVLTVSSFQAADCQPRGCSSSVCSNAPGAATTCQWQPEYACYQQEGVCQPNRRGHCMWARTPELQMCLDRLQNEVLTAPNLPASIPDNDTAGVVSQVVSTGRGAVQEVRVSVRIAHTYRGDLLVTLVSPSGTQIDLHTGEGGSADDLVLTDVAVAGFGGEPAMGTWSLIVRDRYAQDLGELEDFTLTLR